MKGQKGLVFAELEREEKAADTSVFPQHRGSRMFPERRSTLLQQNIRSREGGKE